MAYRASDINGDKYVNDTKAHRQNELKQQQDQHQ
ncbi:unnamed protein product, partial [Rotaria sp. Silwood1]